MQMCQIFSLKIPDFLGDHGVDEDNIKVNFQETKWNGVDAIHLAQNREQW
jgi:hypothetical protein